LRVAELERIGRTDVAREFLVLAVIEEDLEALARAETEVVAALRADVVVLLNFLAIDNLFAVVALDPQPFGNRDLLLDRFLRLLLFAEPRHGGDSSSNRERSSDLPEDVRPQHVEVVLE